jgi:hypothetical protein
LTRGGYREPAHPAPVSGPGALSQRTDGQGVRRLPNAQYGESAQFEADQAGAPMSNGPQATPFDAPTARPGEPVTAGAALGPGMGPEAAGIHMNLSAADAQAMAPMLKSLEIIANLPNSNPSTRNFVRQLRANLGK